MQLNASLKIFYEVEKMVSNKVLFWYHFKDTGIVIYLFIHFKPTSLRVQYRLSIDFVCNTDSYIICFSFILKSSLEALVRS